MNQHVPSILIAEDSPTQQAQLAAFLSKLGYAVSAARSGVEAYDLAVSERPDILISDIIMPEMNGYELCRRLKSTPGLEDTPVILVTSLSQPQDVLAGLQAGADNFIIKPYDEHVLGSRITYLLRNRSLRRAEGAPETMEIEVAGERHYVTARKQQILDLLISTYAQAVHLFTALDQGRQELSQSYEVLHALYDMTDGLNRCRTPSDVANVAVARSLGIPGVRNAWVYLREGETFPLMAQHHAVRGDLDDPFPPAADPSADGEADGAADAPRVQPFEAPGGIRRRHAGIPLRVGSHTIGYLHLAGAEAAISGEMALRTLVGIASQISIALERALLHTQLEEEVRKRTQRLQEEVEERRQATETITAIFNASPVSIISLDGQLKVATFNRTARETFRTDAEAVLGKPWSSLLSTIPDALQEAMGGLELGREMASLEISAPIADGAVRTFHVAGEPLIEAGGLFRGAVLAVDDITDRRQVLEQLHQAQKMEAVGNLTGGMAHDFNNLLTAIIGNLDLAVIKLGEHEARPFLDVALRSSLRGAELTRKLLTFARKQPLEPHRLRVATMMDEMRLLLETSLGPHIALAIRVAPGTPDIFADATHLEAAIMNLAINARDAMPDGGQLSITVAGEARTDGAHGAPCVVFTIADTGTGIAPDQLERIFEPFFTTKESGKGTGLGLAMVYGFASQSGGSLTVESTVGVGTTFRLGLPGMEAEPQEEAPLAGPGEGHEARIVLLVEGNEEIRGTVKSSLERIGHTVIDVPGLDAALACIDSGVQFDVLLTEAGLPEQKSGVHLAGLVLQRWPDCRILLMSGAADPQPPGADGPTFRILRKPFRVDDLRHAIAALF